MRVLIADDDEVSRYLLSVAVRHWEYPLTEVADGEAAWQVLTGEPGPWLAILDWEMPGMDGPAVCRRVRSLSEDRLAHIILLTARGGREDRLAGLAAGADEFMTKPFDRDELKVRIEAGARVLRLQQKLADQVHALEAILGRVKHLRGLLPMCCYCKRIRTDEDYWQQVEHYLAAHAGVQFSHGICPSCYQEVIRPQVIAHGGSCEGPEITS